jgi:hypothetical protein
MSSNNSGKMMGASLHVSICLLGLLSLSTTPASGQIYVRELLTHSIPGMALTAFSTPNNQLRVYYASMFTGDVNQLFFNGSGWSNEDLSAATKTGEWAVLTGMSGFSVGNYQYVFYGDLKP